MCVCCCCRELGVTDAIQAVLEANPTDKSLVGLATQLLTALAGENDLLNAINNAFTLADELMRAPNNIPLIEKLGYGISLISSMAGDPKNHYAIVDNRGLDALAVSMDALSAAKVCLAQEKVMEETSLGLLRLLSTQNRAIHTSAVKGGSLKSALRGFIRHPDYEKLGEHDLAVKSRPPPRLN